MQARQSDIVAEVWAARPADAPVDSPEEMLTLASIIEKETGVSSERDLIAGVFANRLAEGWRLETDPTVIYAASEGRGIWAGASGKANWTPTIPTTPTASVGCRPGRSPIPAGRRLRRR